MPEIRPERASPLPALALALAWGVGPALPALARGELIGHPFTDLYPAVWGLWWFATRQPGLPGWTDLLGWPDGMGFFYSSPIHGWLAWPLVPVAGLTVTWNLLLLAARVGTVLAAWWAARCWGAGGPGALAAAAVYGCAPFFHGYAVEGIGEGTDGWSLALLAGALGRGRPLAAALALGLTALSSWYLGMCGCLLVALAAIRDRQAGFAFLGLVPVLPAVLSFARAFPDMAPLDPGVRAAMAAWPAIPRPGWLPGLAPYAMNAYVGWVVLGAALASRSKWLLLAAIPAVLSLDPWPLRELPGLDLIRFPYRWHAATLLLLAPAVAIAADRGRRWVIGPLVALEGLALGPTEPLLPGSPAEVPSIYEHVDAPIVEVPGPVALPPGVVNPSRSRARYLLYFQAAHGRPSPWRPDFNAVGVPARADALDPIRRLDPLSPLHVRDRAPSCAELDAVGVPLWMIQRSELGEGASALAEALRRCGAREIAADGERSLWTLAGSNVSADPDTEHPLR